MESRDENYERATLYSGRRLRRAQRFKQMPSVLPGSLPLFDMFAPPFLQQRDTYARGFQLALHHPWKP